MTEPLDVCRLSADELADRSQVLRRELAPRIRAREPLADGVALHFDATDADRAALAAFVDFERRCCPGLGFSVSEGGDDSAPGLRLEIRGLDPSAAVLDELGVPPALPPGRGLWAALRATALGTGGAFVLFCLLPMGAAAWLGVEWATSLRALDHPVAIGLGGAVFAAWLWRRERRGSTGCAPGGCRG